MTRILFETASIADSISKAAKVAPTHGAAFDKAHGIIMEVYPNALTPIIIRSTNLDVYYMEWVEPLEVEGDDAIWRLPSQLMAGLMGSMPIGSGRRVEFTQHGTQIIIKQARTQARVNTIHSKDYPDWNPFQEDDLHTVSNLGALMSQVEWAASKQNDPPKTGIHINGEYVVATDGYRIGKAHCSIPQIKEPVTVPAGILSTILKDQGQMKMGSSETQLYIMPDDHTQIRAIIYGAKYPNVEKIMKKHTEKPDHIDIDKSDLIDVINRAGHFAGSDRAPQLKLFIGEKEIRAMMSNEEVGMIGDVVELEDDQADHEMVLMLFTPKNLIDALASCPSTKITIGYDRNEGYTILHMTDKAGYEAWVMPRKDVPKQQVASE